MKRWVLFFLFGGLFAHAQDYIYVSNPAAGTITQIDSSSGNSSIFASGLNSPEGLTFDGAGNLYAADSGDGTISQINSAGTVSTFASGLNGPKALAFDSNGNLCVAMPGSQTIWKINSSGNASAFASGIAFDHDGAYLAADNAGNIYANTTRTVESFDSSGHESQVYGAVEYVEGMALNGAGNLYIAFQNSGFISGNGGLLTGVASYPAPYNNDVHIAAFEDTPCALAFDANGNLYATFSNMVYDGSGGTVVDVNDVLVEFGVNGDNNVVATDIGGTYIAVQSVPEPGIWTFAGGLVGVLCLRRRL